MSATQAPPKLTRKGLYGLMRDRLGHTEEMQKEFLKIHHSWDRLWSLGLHDFGHYDEDAFLYDMIECFADFSRGCTAYFAKWVNENLAMYDRRLNEVLDYGCGIAASSRLFREKTDIGVLAHYYGDPNQGPHPRQRVIGELVCEGTDRIRHVTALSPLSGQIGHLAWDGVMAFELFEHEREPVRLFDDLTYYSETWVVCEASSFSNGTEYGHFPSYLVDGYEVPRHQMGRAWRESLQARGWHKVATGWNSRPQVWVRGA
jgi:hypothetical protein